MAKNPSNKRRRRRRQITSPVPDSPAKGDSSKDATGFEGIAASGAIRSAKPPSSVAFEKRPRRRTRRHEAMKIQPSSSASADSDSDLDFFDSPPDKSPSRKILHSDADVLRQFDSSADLVEVNNAEPAEKKSERESEQRAVMLNDDNLYPRLEPVGAIKEQTYVLYDELSSIGRAPGNTITIRDRMMSKRHAQIRLESDGKYYIEDLHSKNGLFVNNKRTIRHRLAHGDVIIVGTRHFKFFVPGAKEARFEAFSAGGNRLQYIIISLLALLLLVMAVIVILLIKR